MNSIEKTWKEMLNNIWEYGDVVEKDDAVIKESIGNFYFIPNLIKNYDYYYTDEKAKLFLDLVKDGTLDIEDYPIKGEALYRYVDSFNDQSIINLDDNQSFVYTYPERLRKMSTSYGDIDQIDIIIKRLKNHLGSNRAVATLYNCGLDGDREDIPCLNFLQAMVRDNELCLHCVFRSNDIYGAFPSNMFLLSYIGLRLTDELSDYTNKILKFGGIFYYSTSGHIYETDFNAVKNIL